MNQKMKNIFFIVLFFLALFLFSCKGTPIKEDAPPENIPIEEPQDLAVNEEAESEIAENEDDSVEQKIAAEPELKLPELIAELEEETAAPEIAQELVEEDPIEEIASEAKEPEVSAVSEPAPEKKPPLPPPALLGPAEERRPVVRATPSTQTPPASSQSSPALTPPSSIVQTPPQTPPSSGTEDTPSRVDSLSSSPTVSAIRDNPPAPVRSGVLVPHDDKIEFSRIVRATVGQLVEIPFRGSNWVFLGELKAQRGIEFVPPTRREAEGQTFIFRAEEVGTYALKFYRQDFLRDYILNDYVQVIVEEDPISGTARYNAPIDRGRVTALPRWPSVLDEAAILRGGSPSRPAAEDAGKAQSSGAAQSSSTASGTTAPARGTNTQPYIQGDAAPSQPSSSPATAPSTSLPQTATPPQTAPTAAPPAPQSQAASSIAQTDQASSAQSEERLPLDDALQKAKEIFDGGDIAAAIAMLDKYREYYPSGSDELYWLLGQFYEAAGPSRDILLSLDYYRRLVREYPQSRRFGDARRRIAYLERFYININ